MGHKKKKRNLLVKFRKIDVLLEILYEKGLNIKKIFEHRKKLINTKDIIET